MRNVNVFRPASTIDAVAGSDPDSMGAADMGMAKWRLQGPFRILRLPNEDGGES
jgi:hypothetical protein